MRHDLGCLIGSSIALPRLDLEAAAAELRALGFEAIEAHIAQLGAGVVDAPVFEAHGYSAGEAIRAAGLVPSALNVVGDASFDPHGGHDAFEATVAGLSRHLRLADAIGAPVVLVWEGRLGDRGAIPTAIDAVAAAIEQARDRSGLANPPEVGVELHPFTFALALDCVAELAVALRGVEAGICLDSCHFAVARGLDFVDRLDDEVVAAVNHVHLADSDGVTSELHFPPGAGGVDLDRLVGRLAGRSVALSWDLFGWTAPRTAMRAHLGNYAELVERHRASIGLEARP